MKRTANLILFALLTVTAATGCKEEAEATAASITLSADSLVFDSSAGQQVLYVKSSAAWTVSFSESWCSASPSESAKSGTVGITVYADQYSGDDSRRCTLTVKAGSSEKSIAVIQRAPDKLELSARRFETGVDETIISVNYQSALKVTWSIEDDWILPAPEGLKTTMNEGEVLFLVSANNNIFVRTGKIVFHAGSVNDTVVVVQSAQPLSIAADNSGMASSAPQLAAKMHLGWNIGNTLEATSGTSASETSWGNPPVSETLIKGVKAAGFNAIRIPCAWNAYIIDQQTYRIKDSWLARVKEVVGYCVSNDMYAIINIHWDGGWLEENPTYAKQEAVNKKQKALWEQIAVCLRDFDEHVLFAGTNEVHYDYGTPSAENITVQLSYNQTFVDAVRSTGGKNAVRNLVVQAYNTNIDLAIQYLVMPSDAASGRLFAEIHYYDPYAFTLQEGSNVFLWGKDFTGVGTVNYGQEDYADTQFGRMKSKFVDNGIPVIMGEYGPTLRMSLPLADYQRHVQARNYYLNYVTGSALQRGIIPFYWDNGPYGDMSSGLFNRSTGEPVDTGAIAAIISAGQ